MALKGNQKRLDRNNNNRIDAQDFKILKAEKAKGRGQGLQDEKMKPGKTMKAMGGGMMKKYSKGGGYDAGTPGKIRDIVTKYSSRLKSKDRLTDRDLEAANQILKGGRGKALRSTQETISRLKKFDSAKKMGGGMMMRPMGYSKGKSVMAKGCKLGRKKPTKMY